MCSTCSHVQVLVLDEADRMFDLGFIADIRYILRRLPPPERRQSMLFSATLSHRVLELAYEHMNNPELVRIEPDKMTVDQVRQIMYYPSMEEKVPLLIGLLRQAEARPHHGVRQHQAHGRAARERAAGQWLSMPRRSRAMCRRTSACSFLRDFHDGKLAVLIATDVASRGLHIPDVSHVFNFDLPQDAPGLRAPHRPHRARRRRGRRHQLRLRGIRGVAARTSRSYVGHKIPFAPIAPELLATGVVAAPHTHRPTTPAGAVTAAAHVTAWDRAGTRRSADGAAERAKGESGAAAVALGAPLG